MLPVFMRLVCGVLFAGILLVVGVGRAESETMLASWYGPGFEGLPTASGEPFDPYGYTAAHKTLPLGTELVVGYGANSVEVTINDRGPYVGDRELDLSLGAAEALGLTRHGVDYVQYAYAGSSAAYQYRDEVGSAVYDQYGGAAYDQYASATPASAVHEQYGSDEYDKGEAAVAMDGGAAYDQYAPAAQASESVEQYGQNAAATVIEGYVEDQSYAGSAAYQYDDAAYEQYSSAAPESATGERRGLTSYGEYDYGDVMAAGYVGGASYESAGYVQADVFVVSPGHTLSEIAVGLGTSVDDLAASSGVADPDLIYPGQILYY